MTRQHRRQSLRILRAVGHLERHVAVGQRLLRPGDALRDRGLRRQERLRDLLGGQAADHAQRQRDLALPRQHRVRGDEDQPQHVVVDAVGIPRARRPGVSSSRASAAYLASRLSWRRQWSIALRLATVVSQAPALRGTPVSGHCVSASTRLPAPSPRPVRRRRPRGSASRRSWRPPSATPRRRSACRSVAATSPILPTRRDRRVSRRRGRRPPRTAPARPSCPACPARSPAPSRRR